MASIISVTPQVAKLDKFEPNITFTAVIPTHTIMIGNEIGTQKLSVY